MDPNLHQQQGINHLVKVLNYAPFVEEEGKAVVHLTAEDWGVVADTLFKMETPMDMLPDVIESYGLVNANQTIELKTAARLIHIDVI